jgi:hypothetical protein
LRFHSARQETRLVHESRNEDFAADSSHKEIKEGLAAHIIKMLSAPAEPNPKIEKH